MRIIELANSTIFSSLNEIVSNTMLVDNYEWGKKWWYGPCQDLIFSEGEDVSGERWRRMEGAPCRLL